MSPESWQAVVSPDPARDHGLNAEWTTHVVPWYAYAVCYLVLAIAAVMELRRHRLWARIRLGLLWGERVVLYGLVLYALGTTGESMRTQLLVQQAQTAAASSERAAQPVTTLAERMTQNELRVNDHQIWLRDLEETVNAGRRQPRRRTAEPAPSPAAAPDVLPSLVPLR